MTFDTFLGMSAVLCVGLLIFGLVRGFPWFIIKGALVNGPGFLVSLWGIFTGFSGALSTGNAAWWILAALGGAFSLICGFNLHSFLSGEEARSFAKMVSRHLGDNHN